MTARPPEGQPVTDAQVAAVVRLLHRRHGWSRAAATSLIAFALAAGASSSAQSQGTPPPFWFQLIVILLGVLTLAALGAMVTDTLLLRRRTPAVRAQATAQAAHHPGRQRAHHYPPRHRTIWVLRWTGMLLILLVAVLSVPAVVDGTAYLAGAGPTVTFDPLTHQTDCSQYGCDTSTDGILETGGAGVQATWPAVVPLGRPFPVREPVWRWGLGGALINSDPIAVAAVLISLLIEGAAVLVVISLVRLARNWRRHRHQPAVSTPLSASAR
jgi:hypothetical protein